MGFVNTGDAPDDYQSPSTGGGVLVASTNQPLNNGDTWFPSAPGAGNPWYMGSASSLFLAHEPTGGQAMTVFLTFYTDRAGTNTLFSYVYNRNTANSPLFDMIPVLTPFMRMRINTAGGATTCQVSLTQTPVVGGAALFGGIFNANAGRIMAEIQNQPINAGVGVTQPMSYNVPGPAVLSVRGGGQVFEAAIMPSVGPSTIVAVARGFTGANNPAGIVVPVYLPNDDWNLVLVNRGGAAANGEAVVTSGR